MIVTPLKTDIVLPEEQSLLQFLDRNLTRFPEHSILAISAKVIALCEGRTADLSVDKESLIEAEADYFLPKEYRRFGASGTIIHHAFIGAAGIDESNAAGTYVLLPKDPQQTAGAIYNALKKRFAVDRIGVLITDSHFTAVSNRPSAPRSSQR